MGHIPKYDDMGWEGRGGFENSDLYMVRTGSKDMKHVHLQQNSSPFHLLKFSTKFKLRSMPYSIKTQRTHFASRARGASMNTCIRFADPYTVSANVAISLSPNNMSSRSAGSTPKEDQSPWKWRNNKLGNALSKGLVKGGSAWLGERNGNRIGGICVEGEGERDEKGRNRWQIDQPKIWRQSSWDGGGWWRNW